MKYICNYSMLCDNRSFCPHAKPHTERSKYTWRKGKSGAKESILVQHCSLHACAHCTCDLGVDNMKCLPLEDK